MLNFDVFGVQTILDVWNAKALRALDDEGARALDLRNFVYMTAKLAPALSSLESLIGFWDVRIAVPELRTFTGRTIFAPIVQKGLLSMATVLDGDGPPDSYCVFGADENERFFQMLYSDERGGSRVYAGVFNGQRWEMWRRTNGASQRFHGAVSEDGDRIDARWEASEDGTTWRLDFEMTFERGQEGSDFESAPQTTASNDINDL